MARRESVEEQVIGRLRRTDDLPPTAWEIASALEISVDAVRKALVRLTTSGRVIQVGERPRHGARTFRLLDPPEGVR
jgi:predicted ArsR family transcriptional regulator